VTTATALQHQNRQQQHPAALIVEPAAFADRQHHRFATLEKEAKQYSDHEARPISSKRGQVDKVDSRCDKLTKFETFSDQFALRVAELVRAQPALRRLLGPHTLARIEQGWGWARLQGRFKLDIDCGVALAWRWAEAIDQQRRAPYQSYMLDTTTAAASSRHLPGSSRYRKAFYVRQANASGRPSLVIKREIIFLSCSNSDG
jgi:hypothetical protein